MNLDPLAWIDISTEAVRTYVYPDNFKLQIQNPKLLNIKHSHLGGDAHRIQTEDGIGIYVAPGWRAITWQAKPGQPLFTF